MAKKPEISKRSQKALSALSEAVREAVAEHRRVGVPIVVRTERTASGKPARVRERSPSYGTKKRRKGEGPLD